MNEATVLAVIGIGVTIVWGTAQVVASYHPERRRALAYWVVETTLLGKRADRADLEVRVAGVLVTDPRLIRAHLVSYGKGDIASDAFDQGKSVILDIGAPIREVVGTEGVNATHYAVDGSAIEIYPHLVKAGAHYRWDLVCDGPARDTISAPLVDTDTLDPREVWRRNTRGDWWARLGVLLVAGSLLGIGGINIDWEAEEPHYGWPNWVFGGGLLILIFGLSLLSVVRTSKRSRVAQRLLSGEFNARLQGSDGFD